MKRSLGLVGVLAILVLSSGARVQAQAVAFQPVVGSFPNGASLSVTPVVSADRRYVRMSLNPVFTGLEGFDSYTVPAAVSGGPGGPGGGLGGFRSGPVGFAGMNGPMAAPGFAPSPRGLEPRARSGNSVSSDPFEAALARIDDPPPTTRPAPAAPKLSVPKSKASKRARGRSGRSR